MFETDVTYLAKPLTMFHSQHAARCRRGVPLHLELHAAADGRQTSGWSLNPGCHPSTCVSTFTATCRRLCFLCQALEIQNLYRISVKTNLECLECSSVQTLNTYMLGLPLHVKEDHDSLVRFDLTFHVKFPKVTLEIILNLNLFRKAA